MVKKEEPLLKEEQEKLKRAEMRNDNLILMREELDKRALVTIKDRAMHRERRQREALARGVDESGKRAERRDKDFVKDEYGLVDEESDRRIREEKTRQNLMNSPEIEDLQKQLQVAYIRKQLQAQFDEKKLEQVRSSQTIGSDFEQLQKVIKSEADSEEALRLQEHQKKIQYRQLLQDQIINKYKLKQEEYKESLKERALLEDALRTVIEEDQMEEFRKRMKREKIQKEIEDFRKARALWTLREKELQEEQECKIKEYNDMKNRLEEEIKEKERLKREELQRKRIIVSDIMSQRQDTRDEKEQAIIQKYQEERERKFKQENEEEYLKKVRHKTELIEFFARHSEDRKERESRVKQEEQEYIRGKLAEYQEDKKCEEMTAEKRRRLKLAYKSSVLREIEEKRYRARLEKEEEVEALRRNEQEKKDRKKIINEERLRILNQHTGNLVGYLPPGFLRTSDLPHLPQQVRDFYAPAAETTCPAATGS